MNTCSNCQARNHAQARFCAHCGQPLFEAIRSQARDPLQSAPADLSALEPARNERAGGVAVGGGQVQVAGDVAGRDVMKITQTGLSSASVQRLLLIMGGFILAVGFCFLLTATCFFSGGMVLGSVIVALNRPVPTSPGDAQRAEQNYNQVVSTPLGVTFTITTTEVQSSSYLSYILGPKIGVAEPKVRYLESGRIVVGGKLTALGNLPFVATFKVGTGNPPLKLEEMAVQVLQTPNSNLGWMLVPTFFVQAPIAQITRALLGQWELKTIVDASPSPMTPRVWEVTGVRR